MRTAAEYVPARYIEVENGQRPDPRFRSRWSRLRQLRWKASLIMSEHPDVRLYVMKGRSWTNGRFNYGLFAISYNGGGMSPMSFDHAWSILNGISTGLDIADRLSIHSRPEGDDRD